MAPDQDITAEGGQGKRGGKGPKLGQLRRKMNPVTEKTKTRAGGYRRRDKTFEMF